MIVPEFKLKQTDAHVIVFIRVPYIKVTACEFYIEPDTFKFYLKPYLLSLSFEQPLKEAQQPAKAIYYHEKYTLEVHLQKASPGQPFLNLNLLTNILNNKKNKTKKGKVNVEVIGQTGGGVIQEQQNSQICLYNYGFSMNYSNVLDNLEEQTAELFEFDPKSIPLSQRHKLSTDILIKQFDYQSYLFDKYENQQEIKSLISSKGHISYLENRVSQSQKQGVNSIQFRLRMKGKELLVSKRTKENMFKELFSILFSYMYELICMAGQFSAESARTINRTSLVFSSSSYYQERPPRAMLIDCCRRCLTYSLYKSLNICNQTLSYLVAIMDVKYMSLMLLDIRELFERSQPRYLLNKLFVDDYLIYLFSLSKVPEAWQQFCKELAQVKIHEQDLQLGIQQYENLGDDSEEQHEKEKTEKENQDIAADFDRLNTLD